MFSFKSSTSAMELGQMSFSWLQSLISIVLLDLLLFLMMASPAKAADFAKLDEAIPSAFIAKVAPVFDFDTDSCLPSAGISRSSEKNPGLKTSGSITGQCRSANFLDTSNTLHRQACTLANGSVYCGHFYALYFEKDQVSAGLSAGHRHDWEHAAIWTKDNVITHGSVSAHGSMSTRSVSDLPMEGGHMKVVYHKDGGSTHAFRFAKQGEIAENPYRRFVIPTLTSWCNLTGDGLSNAIMRSKLNNFDYGSANVPVRENNFFVNLNRFKPAGYPTFPTREGC